MALRQGKQDAALAELNDLQQLNPNDASLYYERGILYYQAQKFDDAAIAFQSAVKLNHDFSNARYFWGLIADRQGNKTEALSQFEAILKVDPGAKEVQTILDNLRAGRGALESLPSPTANSQTNEPVTNGPSAPKP